MGSATGNVILVIEGDRVRVQESVLLCVFTPGIYSKRLRDITKGPPSPREFQGANWGTLEERKLAKREFEDFVIETWKHLVCMEKGGLGATPCTALFCRIDVGVMLRDQTPYYFVNEVERSLTTSLWMGGMPLGLHGVLADTFGSGLHRWLTWFHDPLSL